MITRHKIFQKNVNKTFRKISNQKISCCVDSHTLNRFNPGTKMIITDDLKPVLIVIDDISINDILKTKVKIAYDLNNQKIFSKKHLNVSYFFKK